MTTTTAFQLPAKAIEEIRQMAQDRMQDVPSPRGAAEFNFQGASVQNAGSNDKHKPAPTPTTTNAQIHQMTHTFLSQIIQSSVTMTEYCGRMTIVPADVAKAKELFAVDDDEGDEDWVEEEGEVAYNDNDEVMGGKNEVQDKDDDDDDALIYDDDDNDYNEDDDVYIDEEKYPSNNAYTPIFDAAYPPVGEIVHLTDEQFYERILKQLIVDVTGSDLTLAEGVDGMFKRAMYAYAVAELCGNCK